jgi:hypothetical protein
VQPAAKTTHLFISLNSVQKVLSALGWLNVFHTHGDALLDDAVAHLLVEFHTNSSSRDVVYDTCAAVVELVWHTLVHRAVNGNIYVISQSERSGVLCQADIHAMLSEGAREGMACSRTITVSVTHYEQECRRAAVQKAISTCMSC